MTSAVIGDYDSVLLWKNIKNDIESLDYVLSDSWFCCGKTLNLIHESKKKFIFGIKSNRIVYKSIEDRKKGNEAKLSELDLEESDILTVFLN